MKGCFVANINHPLSSVNCLFNVTILLLLLLLAGECRGATRYNQRLFVPVKAIDFADPTKTGFRVILNDNFVKNQLDEKLLPTLFISAIPLRPNEKHYIKVIYPDTVYEDKQVTVGGLRERSWYYVCVEWEHFNRHNESTGCDCRLYRTLDRFGKNADTTLSDIEILEIGAGALSFRLRSLLDFPMRITAHLHGRAAVVPALTFFIRESADLDVHFGYLRPASDYGQLCVVEEPLSAYNNGLYTAMGRLISGYHIEKCYFGSLKTKDYDISSSNQLENARVSRHTSAAARNFSLLFPIVFPLLLLVSIF